MGKGQIQPPILIQPNNAFGLQVDGMSLRETIVDGTGDIDGIVDRGLVDIDGAGQGGPVGRGGGIVPRMILGVGGNLYDHHGDESKKRKIKKLG